MELGRRRPNHERGSGVVGHVQPEPEVEHVPAAWKDGDGDRSRPIPVLAPVGRGARHRRVAQVRRLR